MPNPPERIHWNFPGVHTKQVTVWWLSWQWTLECTGQGGKIQHSYLTLSEIQTFVRFLKIFQFKVLTKTFQHQNRTLRKDLRLEVDEMRACESFLVKSSRRNSSCGGCMLSSVVAWKRKTKIHVQQMYNKMGCLEFGNINGLIIQNKMCCPGKTKHVMAKLYMQNIIVWI